MADIDIGQISEALNNKTDRNMRNVDTGAKADSVIDYQEPTAENGYTWYRKCASGWVEQGGVLDELGTTDVFVTLPVVMANINYTVTTSQYINNATGQYVFIRNEPETTRLSLKATNTIRRAYWQVCGIAA